MTVLVNGFNRKYIYSISILTNSSAKLNLITNLLKKVLKLLETIKEPSNY